MLFMPCGTFSMLKRTVSFFVWSLSLLKTIKSVPHFKGPLQQPSGLCPTAPSTALYTLHSHTHTHTLSKKMHRRDGASIRQRQILLLNQRDQNELGHPNCQILLSSSQR